MNRSSFGLRGTWATAVVSLVLSTGVWAGACGGKAIVDGPMGGGGEAGAPTTTTSSTMTVPTLTTTTSTDPPPTSTSTTTPTPTSECEQACWDLWNCGQQDDLCPGFEPDQADGFVQGCIPTCEGSPALIALINPDDCPTTIQTLAAVSSQFAEACYGTY